MHADTPPPPIALITLHAGYSHSSLALRSIAAYCRDEPYYPGIRLYEPLVKNKLDWLVAELAQQRPRIIGFSTYLWNIQASIRLARILKKLLPDACIVFGGPEAGPRGEELLREVDALDFVVDGEGEHAFRDLARRQLYGTGALSEVSGLVRRDEGRILRNPVRALPPEEIPSVFAAGLVELDKPLVYWETSRGCPYRCTFCTSAKDRLRTLPPERIEADLAVIATLRDKTIKLLDRSFHLGAARTTQLLERFAATPDTLCFHLELNPDRISPEAIDIFRKAPPGKFQFEIGLQTLEPDVLGRIERHMDVPKALDNIRTLVALKKHHVHLDLIVGLPEEDATQCRRSLDRAFMLFPDHLQLGTLKLLPGTPLREQATRYGYLWDEEPPYEVLAHDKLSFAELNSFKHYAELLERLWDSGLLARTLMRLVAHRFDGSVSACFDAMLNSVGDQLAIEPMSPETLFQRVTAFLAPYLADDPVLSELLLWDYLHHSLANVHTPAWIAERLHAQRIIVDVDGRKTHLPALALSPEAADVVNRRLLHPLPPGRYALLPQRSLRGRPVRVFALDENGVATEWRSEL